MNTAHLARMRAVEEERMDLVVQIERDTSVPDGMGGETDVPAIVSSLKARVMQQLYTQAQEELLADRPSASTTWIIKVPFGSDVRVTDRIKLGTSIWEVMDNDKDRSEALALTNHCRRNQ